MSSVTAVSIGQWWSVIELDGWRPSGASPQPSNQEVALEGMLVVRNLLYMEQELATSPSREAISYSAMHALTYEIRFAESNSSRRR